MKLTFFDYFFWAASFLGQVALFLILFLRRRWRQFPVFTSYIVFQYTSNILLYEIYQYGKFLLYKRAYWTFDVIDFLFQLGLTFEIARVVLKPTGTWVRDAKWTFITLGCISLSLATLLACLVKPPTPDLLIQWDIRGQFFTSMLICELFLMVMIVSSQLGLVWRNHVMGLGQGLSIWALVGLLVDAVHCLAPLHYYVKLEYVRISFYLAALGYWIITFWREEPQRRELTPEMQAYLASLHQEIQDDLSKVIARNQSR